MLMKLLQHKISDSHLSATYAKHCIGCGVGSRGLEDSRCLTNLLQSTGGWGRGRFKVFIYIPVSLTSQCCKLVANLLLQTRLLIDEPDEPTIWIHTPRHNTQTHTHPDTHTPRHTSRHIPIHTHTHLFRNVHSIMSKGVILFNNSTYKADKSDNLQIINHSCENKT